MQWLKKRLARVESKLVAVQLFLVLPILILLLVALVYWIRSYAITQAKNSSQYLLQTTSNSFDDLYKTTTKLLEIPYTDNDIYRIITTEYAPEQQMRKMLDLDTVNKKLYYSILYYQPNITSVVIVSEVANANYTRKAYPATSPNFNSDMWRNAYESVWYKRTIATEKPVITVGVPNELYQNSGLTVSFSQRLKDVFQNKTLGVMRIDLTIAKMAETWRSMVVSPQDIFFALDDQKRLFFSSNDSFTEQYPLLQPLKLDNLPDGYIVTTQRSPISGFTFCYLTSRQHLLKNGHWLYAIVALITFIYLSGSVVFILWSTRKISGPIQTLKNAMLTGQGKDLTVRCPSLDGEMDTLSEAFNTMMETMGDLLDEVRGAEQEKSQLSYEILQSKISPHFLYNTLNAIRWRADMLGASDVAHTIDSLASLLKFTIKCTDDLIPFDTELSQLENYVDIMRIRYGDDIEINYDIDEQCYSFLCPKFLIQPAMENCYVHAFAGCTRTNKVIMVAVRCLYDSIEIIIEDNGNGMGETQLDALMKGAPERSSRLLSGIGASSLRHRIHALFGEPYDCVIDSKLGEYTRIRVTLPKVPKKEDYNETTFS